MAAIKPESSWSQNDPMEDGGPTIRLPAAETAAPLSKNDPSIRLCACSATLRLVARRPFGGSFYRSGWRIDL
jgi:hypothetical protein